MSRREGGRVEEPAGAGAEGRRVRGTQGLGSVVPSRGPHTLVTLVLDKITFAWKLI